MRHAGGENIFPAEIEERLLQHPCVAEVSVVGLPNDRYGEVVSAFIRLSEGEKRPTNANIQKWVGDTLGRHKVPIHVYWIGRPGIAEDFPKTGSGKHQKHILREMGKKLLRGQSGGERMQERARL